MEIDTESSNPSVTVNFFEIDTGASEMEELYRITINHSTITAVSSLLDNSPTEFLIAECYPNPFNGTTTIDYTLPRAGNVELKIYDLSGREIRSLVKGFKNIGLHNVKWDGKNSDGIDVSSGIYLYKITLRTDNLRNGTLNITKQITYIK